MHVTNLVLTTKVADQLDLPVLAGHVTNAKYVPDNFRGLILKVEKGTCLIFHNGQVVVVGVKTVEEAEKSIAELVKLLGNVGFKATFGVVTPRNIVAFHDFGKMVNLPKLYNQLRSHYEISYEPEISPALMLKLPYTVRIFHNGKVIFTGLKKFDQMDIAFDKVNQLLTSV
jgi:TATA-box binding protein (TBP) (component of TFIID and TFIIIB)